VSSELISGLSALVEQERERFCVPGCAVLVVHGGEVLLRKGFGQRDLARDLPVTEQTLFPIGSSTKTFTAAVCALAVEEGLIGWDEPVVDHLPGFALKDPVATLQLTLRDMLAHRSGLPRHDLLWYAASDGPMSRTELLAAVRHLEPTHGFRETWQYNNILYTAAGELAGRLFGCSYEDAVRKRLLDPLGMHRTGFSVSELATHDDVARPYVVTDEQAGPVEVPFASLDLVGPAGNINSSVVDMTPWLLELAGRPPADREPVLPPSVLERLRTPVIPLSQLSPLSIGRSVGYGAGTAIDDYRGFRVFHHGGNIDGFSSQVAVIPETGSGVVVLTNRNSSGLRDALPYVLFDRLLGLDPQAHGAAVWEKESSLRGAMPGAKPLTEVRADRPPARPFSEYVGTYTHPGYGEMVVERDDERLLLRFRSVAGELVHQQLEVFDLSAVLGGEERHLPVQFAHDLSGEVSAVAVVLDQALPAGIRFERQPDTSALTEELIEGALGTYAMGPLTLVVARSGDGLSVQLEGGPARRVTAVGGLRFAVEQLVVELVPPSAIKTPYGLFERVTDGAQTG
jgi:CubicO group peptidase (beta-lactamase class C family)